MVRAVTEKVPAPEEFDSPADREATERALHYMALEPGTPIEQIASTACSSARAPTRASATCAPPPRSSPGSKVAPSVSAMVVPGSQQVKAQAEAEGLDRSSATPASTGASPAARCAWA